jgi:threonine aldolase
MDDAERKARLRAALDGCDRPFHGRPPTVRDQLTAMLDAGDRYDLDQEPDRYGDGLVRQLEERVAGLLGKSAAAFFPTGTMAQQVALRIWAGRDGNAAVALHPLAHPQTHERGGLNVLAGLRSVHPTASPRLPDADEIRDEPESFGTLMLELPLRDAGFVLPTWEELTAAVQAGRDRGARIHFDGARLWETTVHFGRPLDEIAALADSVYVSFYKSLGGLSGAAVAGPASFVAEAKAWRHRYGGMVYEQFPSVLSALDGLDRELPRLPEYVAHAKTVAAALATALEPETWYQIGPVVTHQFALWLPYPVETLNDALLSQAEETKVSLFRNWRTTPLPGIALTELTVAAPALDWTAADVEAAARGFLSYVKRSQ